MPYIRENNMRLLMRNSPISIPFDIQQSFWQKFNLITTANASLSASRTNFPDNVFIRNQLLLVLGRGDLCAPLLPNADLENWWCKLSEVQPQLKIAKPTQRQVENFLNQRMDD